MFKIPIDILIVDDEPDFVEMLSLRLEDAGHRVRTAHDGDAGLAALTQAGCDVVVLDIRMPGKDGITVLKAIKTDHPLVEVILLTGHGTVDTAVEGLKAGAFDYVQKPARFEELLGEARGSPGPQGRTRKANPPRRGADPRAPQRRRLRGNVESRYQQLFRRMALSGLAVALIPLYLVGAAIYVYFASSLEQNQRAQLQNLAVNRSNAVQLFLAERTAMLEALAHAAPLDALASPGELRYVLAILNKRQQSFVDLGIIDAGGNHVAYEGPYRLEDRNYGGEPWFEETMVRGVHVSDVFLGFRRVPHFVIAVRRDDRPEPWILRATIDSEVFTRLVRSSQIGLTGDAYIVNRDGQYQTPPRFGGEILAQAPFSTTTAPPGVNVVAREHADGRRVLTAFAWMTSKDWLLVVDRDPRGVDVAAPAGAENRACRPARGVAAGRRGGGLPHPAAGPPPRGRRPQPRGHRSPARALGPVGVVGPHGGRGRPRNQQPPGGHR